MKKIIICALATLAMMIGITAQAATIEITYCDQSEIMVLINGEEHRISLEDEDADDSNACDWDNPYSIIKN